MSDHSSSRRLVILGGPSCVGKTPMIQALRRFYPDLVKTMTPIVLYNSRAPRPGELEGKHYYFRSRKQILEMRKKENVMVMEVRGDLQACDLDEVCVLCETFSPLFEGNPDMARMLMNHQSLRHVEQLSVFISPLSRDELVCLRNKACCDLPRIVEDLMRRKLLRRAERQKSILSGPDLEDIERRAGNAFRELKEAHRFHFVIPNHDGEDSDNWDVFYFPLGDARRSLRILVDLLRGNENPDGVENWDEALLGDIDPDA